ncbi:FAD-binding and (Fe-S)-binding domain-containing protein (plasmid) [Nocardioides sp. R1-1]|uniref:FAD-binding and (Fe-S)-binding domain-containing protein n=1 Tax=Nocardioides sp. R1-1 TaxID=3383502 RepID=UPI0038D18040
MADPGLGTVTAAVPAERFLSALDGFGIERDRVRNRAVDLAGRAADASHYQLTPSVVVVAQDADDVARTLAAATKERVGVTFRSGGTSLSGQGVTDQVLLDTRRHFRGVRVLDDGRQVRAEPGATVRTVNAALARFGRRLGPDPASEGACTIGGVIANNSSGMSCGIHANAYRTVLSLDLLLPGGTRIETGEPGADDLLRRKEPALYGGLARLRDRTRAEPEDVATIRRLFAIKNTVGYSVNALLDHDRAIDILAHLMIGSEGTLGFVAAATFATVPAPRHATTGLLVMPTLDEAAALVPTIAATGAASIELMDARSLQVAASGDRPLRGLTHESIGRQAALLVEFHADSSEDLAAAEHRALDAFAHGVAGTRRPTRDAHERAELWQVRKGLYTAVAGARPAGTTALLEDIAVPQEQLSAACRGLGALFDDFGYEDSVIFGHAKDGNVHFLVNEEFANESGVERYRLFTEAMVDLVLEHGGTLKAEHGTGRVMAPFVPRQYGPRLFQVMREIKDLCDPAGIMNPGIVLTTDPDLHLRDLKVVTAVEEEVDRCTECGYCEPVCPSRDLTLTPRQRIAVRRAAATALERGEHESAQELLDEFHYDGVQTCAADGMCQTACPLSIDTGALVRRLRAEAAPATQSRAGTWTARHWRATTGAVRRGLNLAARLPRTAELLTLGARRVVSHELLPLYPGLPAAGRARVPWQFSEPAAIVIPSCTVGMFGSEAQPDALEALLSLCRKAGLDLAVPERPASLCCGTPWSSKGLLEGYGHMVDRLRGAVDAVDPSGDMPVIADASSCSEGLVKALEQVGRNVEDAVSFVAREVVPRISVRRVEARLAVHPTCSSHRLDASAALFSLAQALSDDIFVARSWGCCGFAGDRGLLHPELTNAATRVQADEVIAAEADEHISCNRTCELGMTLATGRGYRHVLQLLDARSEPLAPTR